MPVSFHHYVHNGLNVAIWNSLMEQVRHGIYEDSLRTLPAKGLVELFGNESKVEALLVWMSLHSSEPFCKCLRVTVFASGTDLRTAANGFHVASVHSIEDRSATTVPLACGICSGCLPRYSLPFPSALRRTSNTVSRYLSSALVLVLVHT